MILPQELGIQWKNVEANGMIWIFGLWVSIQGFWGAWRFTVQRPLGLRRLTGGHCGFRIFSVVAKVFWLVELLSTFLLPECRSMGYMG